MSTLLRNIALTLVMLGGLNLACFGIAWAAREGDADPAFNAGQNVLVPLNAAHSAVGSPAMLGMYKTLDQGSYISAIFYKNASGANYSTEIVHLQQNGQPVGFAGTGRKVVLSDPDIFMTGMAALPATDSTVMAGYYTAASGFLEVCAYSSDGLPETFLVGHNGVGCISFSATTLFGAQANGLITNAVIYDPANFSFLISGSINDTTTLTRSLFVLRLNTNGTIATSFANNGVFKYAYNLSGGTSNDATALALDHSGRILVAGYTQNGTGGNRDFAVLRLTSAGTIDSCKPRSVAFDCAISFDFHRAGAFDDRASTISVDSAGNIYVAGNASNDATSVDATAVMKISDQFALFSFPAASQFADYVDTEIGNSVPASATDDKGRLMLVNGDTDHMSAWRILDSGIADATYDNGTMPEPGRVKITRAFAPSQPGEHPLDQARIFFDGDKLVVGAITTVFATADLQLVVARRLGDDTIFRDGFETN